MAVQKSKVTRSRRGMRRAHQSLAAPTLTEDAISGDTRMRHHMGPDGSYRGRVLAPPKPKKQQPDTDESS